MAEGGEGNVIHTDAAGDGVARHSAPPAPPVSRRETSILAVAVTAVPLLVAGVIGIIPQLHGLWPTAIAVAVVAGIVIVLGALIVRSAHAVLVAQGADAEIVAYKDNRETGILYKGGIENVALRVSTIHLLVDHLTQAIPEEHQQQALYSCGYVIGENWVPDFQRQLPRLGIDKHDILHQLLKWSEYDATAGMGRLNIAIDPRTGTGLVALSNSFLSRSQASFPLNWWFAGYLAGSLTKLLTKAIYVSLTDESPGRASTTVFQVTPVPRSAPPPSSHVPHPASRARAKVWFEKLKRPLPDEVDESSGG